MVCRWSAGAGMLRPTGSGEGPACRRSPRRKSVPRPGCCAAAGRRGWRSSAASRTPSRRSVRSGSPRRGRCAAGRACGRRSSYGPPPPQPGTFGTDARRASGDDWLSLNVWSPDPAPAAGLPVLVWIPGGGYVIGTSGLPEFDGGRLAGRRRRRGDAQLPAGHGGFRADRRRPRQPGPARPGRRAAVGAGQHPGLRRRPGPGDGLRRVGRWRIGRRAAGHAARGRAVPPGRRAERAGDVLLARAGRRHRRRLRRRAGGAADAGRPVRRGPRPGCRPWARRLREDRPVAGPVGADHPPADPVRAGRRRRRPAGDPVAGVGRRCRAGTSTCSSATPATSTGCSA